MTDLSIGDILKAGIPSRVQKDVSEALNKALEGLEQEDLQEQVAPEEALPEEAGTEALPEEEPLPEVEGEELQEEPAEEPMEADVRFASREAVAFRIKRMLGLIKMSPLMEAYSTLSKVRASTEEFRDVIGEAMAELEGLINNG